MSRLTRTARVVLIGSAIGMTSTCSHFQVGGAVGAAESKPAPGAVAEVKKEGPAEPRSPAIGSRAD